MPAALGRVLESVVLHPRFVQVLIPSPNFGTLLSLLLMRQRLVRQHLSGLGELLLVTILCLQSFQMALSRELATLLSGDISFQMSNHIAQSTKTFAIVLIVLLALTIVFSME